MNDKFFNNDRSAPDIRPDPQPFEGTPSHKIRRRPYRRFQAQTKHFGSPEQQFNSTGDWVLAMIHSSRRSMLLYASLRFRIGVMLLMPPVVLVMLMAFVFVTLLLSLFGFWKRGQRLWCS